MIWTWDDAHTPVRLPIRVIMSFRRALQRPARLDAHVLIYRPAGFRPGGEGFIDSVGMYTVSEMWPFMAFMENNSVVLVSENKVMEFMVFCGYGAEHSAIVAGYLGSGARPHFCEPEGGEEPDTRRIVKLIDMGVVSDDFYDSRAGRGIALRPGIQLVADHGDDLVSTEGYFSVYPGSADRWLGELADGTLFVGQADYILTWLNEHDQDVPEDLQLALARG